MNEELIWRCHDCHEWMPMRTTGRGFLEWHVCDKLRTTGRGFLEWHVCDKSMGKI